MKEGDFIRIDYIGRIKDTGEIFDLTIEEVAKKEGIYDEKREYKPVPVIVGEGFVIKGLDKALLSMNVGERKIIELKPEEAFGERRAELIKIFPLSFFEKQNVKPEQGMIVNISGIYGRIQSCNSGRVRVDFNNPLAGKDIIYDIEIKEVVVDDQKKIEMILEYFGIKGDVKIKENSVEIECKELSLSIKKRIAGLIKKYIKKESVKFIEIF
jgi:FKBP-type peptidyl-prolyl cis-trans isomerase SlyD